MDDDIFEVSNKNYQKISENLEKSGYREGVSGGQDSTFQQSFDNGYEDGFRIGFALGKAQKEKANRGKCQICVDQSLLQKKTEAEIRNINKTVYENESF